MNSRRHAPLPALLVTLAAFSLGCATAAPETLPAAEPLSAALSRVGTVESDAIPGDALHVVVIRDRHSLGGGLRRVRSQLRDVHREVRLAIDYLVANGYGLLGCEYPLGELQPDETTDRHYAYARERLRIDDDPDELDRWNLYQPIRHQLAFDGRLLVYGVEDPTLYAEDVAELESWLKSLQVAKRRDRPEQERLAAMQALKTSERNLARYITERGRAAGKNLATLMNEQGRTRATLLLGGAHVASAVSALEAAGVTVTIFKPASYDAVPRRRSSSGSS